MRKKGVVRGAIGVGLVIAALLANGAAAQLVLVDQPLTSAPLARGGLISTVATNGSSAQQIATGFVLSAGEEATSLEWWGAHDSASSDPLAANLELRLFADAAGLPETFATETLSLDFTATATGLATGNGDAIYHYTASLEPPLLLFTGAQWISIVEVAPTPGDWLWVSSDEVPVEIADRFGTDAALWTPGLSFRGNRAIRVLPEPGLATALGLGVLVMAAARRRQG